MSAPRPPEVGFFCDGCDRYTTWTVPFEPGDDACAHCGRRNPPSDRIEDSGDPPRRVESCPQCGNPELYVKKDLPQQAGCAVVILAIALATVAYAIWDFPGAFVVFAVVAVADFAIYRRLPMVTVCYRCHAELRRFAPNPAHGAFDMHRAEEYEAGR